MIKSKTQAEIEKLKIGGQKLAKILRLTAEQVKPGVDTDFLNSFAHGLIVKEGGKSPFLGYKPYGAKRPFPADICISINEEIVHGIPNEDPKTIQEGDIVGLDLGFLYEGLITDHAITVPVGPISKEAKNLLSRTKEALQAGIKQAVIGNKVGDIGHAIERVADSADLFVIDGLTGHGVGYAVHEEPYVPNFGHAGTGETLFEGMVIAIEPMFSIGSSQIKVAKDGYTYLTKDGSLAAQFEHTIAITKDGPLILTKE
jgi:methionyl aminopeptidase